MSFILDRLRSLVAEGLHPLSFEVHYLPGGAVLCIRFQDWIPVGTCESERQRGLPSGGSLHPASREEHPEDWSRLPPRSWQEVEAWVLEAAWVGAAVNVTRRECTRSTGDLEFSGAYGPFAPEGWDVEHHVTWWVKPLSWGQSYVPERRLADMPDWNPPGMIDDREEVMDLEW